MRPRGLPERELRGGGVDASNGVVGEQRVRVHDRVCLPARQEAKAAPRQVAVAQPLLLRRQPACWVTVCCSATSRRLR